MNTVIGVAAALGVLSALATLSFLARRNARRLPVLVPLAALAGLALIEVGIGQGVADHHPFDPARTRLTLSCHAAAIRPGMVDAPTIRFDYDPTRQCQGHTFYEYLDGRLERVVVQSLRRGGQRVYEARRLTYRPSWVDPERRGVFVKATLDLSAGEFSALNAALQARPILCPAPGDAPTRAEMSRRAADLRLALINLNRAPSRETRWDCAPGT